MEVIVCIGIGLVTGSLARFVMPGPNPFGMLGTYLLAIGGAFLGASFDWATNASNSELGTNTGAMILALASSMFVLFAYRAYAVRAPE